MQGPHQQILCKEKGITGQTLSVSDGHFILEDAACGK